MNTKKLYEIIPGITTAKIPANLESREAKELIKAIASYFLLSTDTDKLIDDLIDLKQDQELEEAKETQEDQRDIYQTLLLEWLI